MLNKVEATSFKFLIFIDWVLSCWISNKCKGLEFVSSHVPYYHIWIPFFCFEKFLIYYIINQDCYILGPKSRQTRGPFTCCPNLYAWRCIRFVTVLVTCILNLCFWWYICNVSLNIISIAFDFTSLWRFKEFSNEYYLASIN